MFGGRADPVSRRWRSTGPAPGSSPMALYGVGCRVMGSDVHASSEDLPASWRSGVSPDVVRSYRYQLTPDEDVIDTATWAGSVPQVNGIAPRVRVGRSKWFNLLWLLPISFLLLIILIAVTSKFYAPRDNLRVCAMTRSCNT